MELACTSKKSSDSRALELMPGPKVWYVNVHVIVHVLCLVVILLLGCRVYLMSCLLL